MKVRFKLKFALLLISICGIIFQIESLSFASEIYPLFRGVRAEGMGGAAVATVNDETALFLNPAGLGKIRGGYFAIANPEVEFNQELLNAMGGSNNYTAVMDTQQLFNTAKASPDKHMHAKVQMLPAYITTNFGVGVLGKYSFDSEFKSATQTYHIDYFNDYAATIGYCFRLFEGRIKIGVAGKIINRVYINKDLPASSTGLTLNSLASEGTGAGWDGGLLLTGPWTWLPTIGAAAHDIGNTNFNLGNGYFVKSGVQPPPQTQSIDVAIGISPIHSNRTRSSWTVEWRDVQNPETQDVYRRIHAGVEFNINDVLFIRGGMNQRYYTAGIELAFGLNQLQVATYGEEIGTPTSNREDRRFVVEYGLRF